MRLAALLLAVAVSAQESLADSARSPIAVPDSIAAKYLDVGLRSSQRAFMLSLLNTAVPIGLAFALADSDPSRLGS